MKNIVRIATACSLLSSALVWAGPVTWTKDVAPIVQERCLECHRPGQVAPMSLMTFEQARPWAAAIKKNVAAGKMPPWPAETTELAFQGDNNLSQREIDTIVAWVDQGAAFGKAEELPAPREFKTFEGGWRLGNPDVVLEPAVPFTVKGDITDLYQCFEIPFGVDHEVWLKGVEFQPGNTQVAHHFILFEDTGNAFPKLDAETPEPGCECADMGKIPGARVVKMWAPGNTAPLALKGIAQRLTPGKNLVLQAHYYNSTGVEQVDHSRVALHLAKPSETIDKQLLRMMVSANVLDIPAGDPNVPHEAHAKALKDMTVYSVGVHMHLRGKSMGQWAVLPDTTKEITMVWVPEYDFGWQMSYQFVEPFKAPVGTEFIMRSVHDNSADNPNNPDPTKDVHWGLYSADEMAFSGQYFTLDEEKLGITPMALSAEDIARLDIRARQSTD